MSLKFTWKGTGPRKARHFWGKESEETFPMDIKTIVTNTTRCWHRDRLTDTAEWKARNNTHTYRKTGHMTGVALQISRGKNRYSRHVTGGNVISKRGEKKKKQRKLDPNCIVSMKSNSRWIKDLNVKGRNFKLLEQK